MKKLTILALGLVGLAVFFTLPVWAAQSTINVTVTPKLISLSVDPGSYDYGALDLNASAETTTTFEVMNTGNVDEGTDTTNWTLAGAVGVDAYKHEWKEGAGSYSALTTSNQPAATSVSSSGSKDFRFKLWTPTSSTSFNAQNASVTFTASES